MRKSRLLLGIALVAAGIAVVVLAARSMLGDRGRAQAALPRPVAHVAERGAPERAIAEKQVWEAARLPPLAAALRAHVDDATLLDLFDNEDWWRPYRAAFPIVRIRSGGRMIVGRGTDIGSAAQAVVAAAERQRVASAVVDVGPKSYVLAATRVAAGAELDAVLVLGQPIAATAVAAPAPSDRGGHSAGDRPGLWLLGVGAALGGMALIVSGRRGGAASAVPVEVPHQSTSRMGTTPAHPRAMAASGSGIAPETRNGRITDGNAVSIRGGHGPALTLAASRQGPGGVGATFGRYRLIERLGEGGMSELFIAEVAGVEGFTRNFVLKRLRPELAREKEAVAQFIDEARMQAGLVHSNIVPVFDFGVVGGDYFMTQEYIVGRDLARFVERYVDQTGAGLPEPMAYFIAHETLQALAYAHDRCDKGGAPLGLVHRDISASNIMMSLLGEVKLSDFGIVKANRRVSKTQVGMVKGNANFMSPEQARGQPVDHRSDLFSLAHVLYYCLTGRLLYAGENDLDVLYRAASGITAADLAAIRALPDPAGGILEKALAFEPSHRFQSAAEFADALAAHAGGGKAAIARLVQQMFGEELQRQAVAPASAG